MAEYTISPPSQGSRERYTVEPPASPPSFSAGVGAGLMDKVYGLAQMGAHASIDAPPISYTPAQESAGQVQPEAAKALDASLRERERSLDTQGYNRGWGRTLGGVAGDVALTAPLSFIAPEAGTATWLARTAEGARAGALGGAIGGAATPETSREYDGGKIKQIATAATEGGIGGAALGALTKAIGLGTPADAEAFIKNAYTRSVRPSVQGKSSFTQQDQAYARARQAMDEIVKLKPTLALTNHETGEVAVGELPKSLTQFGEAIDQGKKSIFARYDALANQAETAGTGKVTTVRRFQEAFADASRKETEASHAVRTAQQTALLATAQQARAGENVYMSSAANAARREAERRLSVAREALDKAASAKVSARKKMGGVWIDLEPTVRELRSVGQSTLKEIDPKTVAKANALADRLASKAAYSPLEAQEAIRNYNARVANFYKQPTKDGTSEAAIEAMVANRLREATDTAISDATGREYQPLKDAYGALRSIEKDVVHRALVQGRNTKGGLTGMLFDVATADQVIHAIAHLDPSALGSAAGWQTFKAIRQRLLDPNRAVRRMFETAERLQQPNAGSARSHLSSGVRRIIPQTGAMLGYQSPANSALGVQ